MHFLWASQSWLQPACSRLRLDSLPGFPPLEALLPGGRPRHSPRRQRDEGVPRGPGGPPHPGHINPGHTI
jgi:hypothetical protein